MYKWVLEFLKVLDFVLDGASVDISPIPVFMQS